MYINSAVPFLEQYYYWLINTSGNFHWRLSACLNYYAKIDAEEMGRMMCIIGL